LKDHLVQAAIDGAGLAIVAEAARRPTSHAERSCA
jgi:hypothetical protein